MKGASDNKTVDWVDTLNAVLTPHLIHPNFFKSSGVCSRQGGSQDFGPISKKVKIQRKSWCERQLNQLQFNQSNAVLGGGYDQ